MHHPPVASLPTPPATYAIAQALALTSLAGVSATAAGTILQGWAADVAAAAAAVAAGEVGRAGGVSAVAAAAATGWSPGAAAAAAHLGAEAALAVALPAACWLALGRRVVLLRWERYWVAQVLLTCAVVFPVADPLLSDVSRAAAQVLMGSQLHHSWV